ncbi:hypothetical protein GH5_07563 [Leishmania sp. Ghana 2012 LV757]|uniref:hypothetical protein n=1 Tax=Leishmania sp. Ghana 2012 LV757 TaxID=2803181 RepID=UPI001B48D3ED|nr:hypothetical protein GH5_07563 [Leishmania sp. Ghana 2012 LV757]
MLAQHISGDTAQARPRRIVECQRAPPPTMAAASSFTTSLVTLSCAIVLSLYATGFLVMMLAVAHRRRSVRRARAKLPSSLSTFLMAANSEEAYTVMGPASDVAATQAVPTSRTAPAGGPGSLQDSNPKVHHLVDLQSRVESYANDEEESVQVFGSEAHTVEAVSLVRTKSLLCGGNRSGEAGSNGAGTKRLPASVALMSTVTQFLLLEDQDYTAVKDEASGVSVACGGQVDPEYVAEPRSLPLTSPCIPCTVSGATATEGNRRCGHGSHHHRERLPGSRRGSGSATPVATAAHVAGTATWSAPSSESSMYHSSEWSSALLPDTADAATAAAVVAANARSSTSPLLLRYVPLSPARISLTPCPTTVPVDPGHVT